MIWRVTMVLLVSSLMRRMRSDASVEHAKFADLVVSSVAVSARGKFCVAAL